MNLLTETRETYLKATKSCERKEKRVQAKIKNQRLEIESIQKKIEDLQSKKSKINSPWWGDALIKPIIDEIDRVLAEHYGFTDRELDFIINYDIKYRLGQKGN